MMELVIVLTIVSLIALVALPNIRPHSDTLSLKTFSYELVGRLRSARTSAITEGRDVAFVLDSSPRSYRLSNSPLRRTIPDGVGLEITTAKPLIRAGESAQMVFFPDGSSTGGTITLTKNAHSAYIEVDWLTGSVHHSHEGQ